MNGVTCQRDGNESVEVMKWLCTSAENAFLFLFGCVQKC